MSFNFTEVAAVEQVKRALPRLAVGQMYSLEDRSVEHYQVPSKTESNARSAAYDAAIWVAERSHYAARKAIYEFTHDLWKVDINALLVADNFQYSEAPLRRMVEQLKINWPDNTKHGRPRIFAVESSVRVGSVLPEGSNGIALSAYVNVLIRRHA